MASGSDQKQKSTWGGGTGWLVTVLLLWFAFDPWHSKLRYSLQYRVAYGDVTKANEPHDCDFFKAPIGNKECHFEIQVGTVRAASDTNGKPILSIDEGVTWFYQHDPDTPYTGAPVGTAHVTTVNLTWEKIKDE
jgi:hypothetical protein